MALTGKLALLRRAPMFYLSYVLAELRRRRGRTLLTALGLGVGVGLVVTVSALSSGLDRAQDKVLHPLTGVGTDMSVTRPLKNGGGAPDFGNQGLSRSERGRVRRENGPRRFGLRSLGKPGQHFEDDNFATATQLSFPETEAAKLAGLPGAKDAAAGLTVTAIHVSGTVPKNAQRVGPPVGGPPSGGPPNNIDLDSRTVTGVDSSKPTLAAVSASQISRGRYLRSGKAREAVLNSSYARRHDLGVGDTVTLKKEKFTVVGLAKSPLGGQASDIYVKLGQLQRISGREGRANVVYVRADDSGAVDALGKRIDDSFAGAQVTTTKDLADRVGGSLVDAKNLASKLGAALEIVALLAAFLIACLLTLSSVTKRTRELGTLKAIGWPQRLVVRQVAVESVFQGLLGGLVGAAIGIAGALAIDAVGPSLTASVAQAAQAVGPGGGGPGPGPFAAAFGQGQVTAGSTSISLDAPVHLGLLLLAIALALLGGLVAGSVGGLRVARLRPADALRHIE
ncbi:MAG TPA: ABC transporter permease [Thermoleophilaceae bacterium]